MRAVESKCSSKEVDYILRGKRVVFLFGGVVGMNEYAVFPVSALLDRIYLGENHTTPIVRYNQEQHARFRHTKTYP